MASQITALVGNSPEIAGIQREIEQVASTTATVLILGETGTGKELVAREIHARSRRSTRPYVTANCGGFVASLAASELFGHEVGAFTGAVKRRCGRFEAAHTGTLFLDEVGELTTEVQPLLLRVLEERAVERIGGESVPVDVRLIAATNRDLAIDAQNKRFRADLYYRLNVFPISLPPLRERRSDIPALASHFLRYFAQTHNRTTTTIPDRVLELLTVHDWPGNIRQLRNVIERAVIVSTGSALQVDPAWLFGKAPAAETVGRSWAAQEKERILEALRAVGGRIYGPGGAAHRLGLRPTTLYSKMRKHGISKDPSSWE